LLAVCDWLALPCNLACTNPHLNCDSTLYGEGRVAVMPWMRGCDELPKLEQ
jgi:hypothetical protein